MTNSLLTAKKSFWHIVVYRNWRSFSLSATSVRARSFSLSSIFIFPLPPNRTASELRWYTDIVGSNFGKQIPWKGATLGERLTNGRENLFRPSNCIFLSGGSRAADSSSNGSSYLRLTGWWMSIFSPTIPAPISRGLPNAVVRTVQGATANKSTAGAIPRSRSSPPSTQIRKDTCKRWKWMEKRHPSLNHLGIFAIESPASSQVPLCEMNASRNVSDPIDRPLRRSLLLIFDYPWNFISLELRYLWVLGIMFNILEVLEYRKLVIILSSHHVRIFISF